MQIRSPRKAIQYHVHVDMYSRFRYIFTFMNTCESVILMYAVEKVVTLSRIAHYVYFSDSESPGPPQPHDHGEPEPFVPVVRQQAAIHAHCDP